MNENFLFADTETGGLNPFKHSLLQVGLVAYVNGQVKDMIEINISQECYVVTPEAMKFNGIDLMEIKSNGVPPKEALWIIANFCKRNFSCKPILVGHNPSLDKYMIRELFELVGLDMDSHISHRMIDTMSIIWGLHFAGKLPIEACSSDGAFEHFGIKFGDRHRALSDAMATVELYRCLIKLLRSD